MTIHVLAEITVIVFGVVAALCAAALIGVVWYWRRKDG